MRCSCCVLGLTRQKKFSIMIFDIKCDDAEKLSRLNAKASRGRCKPGGGIGSSALRRASGEEPGVSPALWAIRGRAFARQPEWYRECVCSSPDGRRFLFAQKRDSPWADNR